VRLVASDRAGNRSVITRTLAVDRAAPRVHIDRVPALIGTAHPTLRGSLDDASPVTVKALLDGASVALRAPDGQAMLGDGAITGRFSLPLQRMSQGVHELSITVTDAAGNSTTATAGPFTVDSTEKLRSSTVLSLGARGADVVQLERRLKAFGLYKGPFTRFYNGRTETAVRAFQRAHDLPVTGIATPQLLQLSAERIVVHLNRFRVYLIRDGKLVFSAPIAIGQPAYPTPTGHYEIISKIKNPTWVPPNSPWAAGLEAIPPGSSNPLGTRWIGTSAPNIGFHATPLDYSVGHAASHGCMRMHRPDVERLYDLIRVGTPVDIEV
jgi:peptidoglycan hydrolase-like protein with peptidoglycan-binding domain